MAESAVVNASPLIFLSRAGLINLLQLVSAEVIVPESVATEIEVRGKRDPTSQVLANTSWLVVTQTPPVPTQIQAWGLGPGESARLSKQGFSIQHRRRVEARVVRVEYADGIVWQRAKV